MSRWSSQLEEQLISQDFCQKSPKKPISDYRSSKRWFAEIRRRNCTRVTRRLTNNHSQPPPPSYALSCNSKYFDSLASHISYSLLTVQNDKGYDRQASNRAEEALGKQTPVDVPVVELGHDCVLSVDDLEGINVYDQGE